MFKTTPLKASVAALALGAALTMTPTSFASASQVEIPLINPGHGHWISVTINGVPLPVLVDSGSDDVCLSNQAAAALIRHGALPASDVGEISSYRTASGSIGQSQNITIRELNVGGFVGHHIHGSIGCANTLLGNTYLDRLGTYAFDNDRNVLVLTLKGSPAPTYTAPSAPTYTALPSYSPAYGGTYGAIAWDRGTGRYGVSWNQPSGQRAEQVALGECGGGSCEIVNRITPHQCGALAVTHDGRTAGAARRSDRSAAALAAVNNCASNNAGQCIVVAADCNR